MHLWKKKYNFKNLGKYNYKFSKKELSSSHDFDFPFNKNHDY